MNNKYKYIILSIYFIFTFLFRTSLHIAPNVEFVTAFSVISSLLFINSKKAYIFPIILMILTDLIIGNTLIFLFTWTGFLIPVFLSKRILNKKLFNKNKLIDNTISSLIIAIISTFGFYLWTNLGVVIITQMYDKSLLGLLNSYINAIPFLKLQLIGNIFFVPIFVLSYNLLISKLEVLLNRIYVNNNR